MRRARMAKVVNLSHETKESSKKVPSLRWKEALGVPLLAASLGCLAALSVAAVVLSCVSEGLFSLARRIYGKAPFSFALNIRVPKERDAKGAKDAGDA